MNNERIDSPLKRGFKFLLRSSKKAIARLGFSVNRQASAVRQNEEIIPNDIPALSLDLSGPSLSAMVRDGLANNNVSLESATVNAGVIAGEAESLGNEASDNGQAPSVQALKAPPAPAIASEQGSPSRRFSRPLPDLPVQKLENYYGKALSSVPSYGVSGVPKNDANDGVHPIETFLNASPVDDWQEIGGEATGRIRSRVGCFKRDFDTFRELVLKAAEQDHAVYPALKNLAFYQGDPEKPEWRETGIIDITCESRFSHVISGLM